MNNITRKININKTKVILIAVCMLFVLTTILLVVLYTNGLLGIHHHTEPDDGQIKVACVGDSITYGHGVSNWQKNNYPAQLQDILGDGYHVENFGHSGRTLSNDGDSPYTESKQYKLSLEYDADIIIFMLGTNDSKPDNWTDADTFIAEYEALLDSYRENNPDVRIILCTPPRAFFTGNKTDGKTSFDIQPAVVEEIVTRIKTFALLNEYECIDIYDVTQGHSEWFCSDKVHPNADGARAIAEAVANKINK